MKVRLPARTDTAGQGFSHVLPKVLISAYACEPGRGSEPGVGWNWVRQMAQRHRVWVITRRNNRSVIEAGLDRDPMPNATFVYYDPPSWACFWKRRSRGVYLYYYLWQLGAYLEARRLHSEIGFDLAHHATFVMYWMPSFMALLGVPFVWGPVGGGEEAPRAFHRALSRPGKLGEFLRAAAQAVGRLDPFVRMTARRSTLALGTTPQTELRLRQIGCRQTAVFPVMALHRDEIEYLSGFPRRFKTTPFRIASMGKLVSWKGVQLSLRAFAAVLPELPEAEFWIIGDGPERRCLEALSAELRIQTRARFLGALPRQDALRSLAECDIMINASLHDSGSFVCTEAMAMGRPVVCLELGGPALQVTRETGILVPAVTPEQAVTDLAAALRRLGLDPQLRRRMGEAARRRVKEHLSWDAKGRQFDELTRTWLQRYELAGELVSR